MSNDLQADIVMILLESMSNMYVVFNTIRLCAANIDSRDLAMPIFYWYEQFG